MKLQKTFFQNLAAGLFWALAVSLEAQTNFTILKSFTSVPDGNVPYCTLTADTNGWLYGTTLSGGTSSLGSIFAIKTNAYGYVNVFGYVQLGSFVGTNGANPYGGVTLGADGNLYGTTYSGGIANFGTVFAVHKDGTGFVVLHSFAGGNDGKNPQAGLIEGSDGALYGTTYFTASTNRGTIFKINKDGSGYTVLHIFTGAPDGQQPLSRLLEGTDGMLYGTASLGGTHSNGGILFKLNKDGSSYSTAYNFRANSGDGYSPRAGLIEGSDQSLYGTTYSGGGTGTNGTVFKINKDGSAYQILHRFASSGGEGQSPNGELVEAIIGTLYGCTYAGGTLSQGVIYRLNNDGSNYKILRSFAYNGDGSTPTSALLRLGNGILYGTTQFGGMGGAGCVFAVSTNILPPRIISQSISSNTNLLQCLATSTVQFDVQRSTNLIVWSTLATLTSQTNGQLNYTDTNLPPRNSFYRLKEH